MATVTHDYESRVPGEPQKKPISATPPIRLGAKGKRMTPKEIVALWVTETRVIPPQFALGSAYHETHYNPKEVDKGDQGDGTDSIGLYQISQSEAKSVGLPNANLQDARDNTKVFARLMERNLAAIIKIAKLDPHNLPSDVWAYLALSHNQGLTAALKTIEKYKLNWKQYAARNAAHPNWIAYYADAVNGGPDWKPELLALV